MILQTSTQQPFLDEFPSFDEILSVRVVTFILIDSVAIIKLNWSRWYIFRLWIVIGITIYNRANILKT